AFGVRIEAHDGIGVEVGEPDLVVLVHPHRVGLGLAARQLPLTPRIAFGCGGVVDADLAGHPFADPDAALRVAPHPARALAFGRGVDRCRLAALRVYARDVVAGERGVVHVAGGRGGDAVRP